MLGVLSFAQKPFVFFQKVSPKNFCVLNNFWFFLVDNKNGKVMMFHFIVSYY